MNFNIQCIRNKLLNFEALIEGIDNIKIICLTEHWLREDEAYLYAINNFILKSKFCRTAHKHGGVSIYVHQSLQACEIKVINDMTREIHCEVTAVYIKQLNGAKTCPDNIFCSFSYESAKVISIGMSDHDPQLLTFRSEAGEGDDEIGATYRKYNNSTLDAFKIYLAQESLSEVYKAKTANAKVDAFLNIFMFHFSNAFPIHTVSKTKTKLMTPELYRLKDLKSPTSCGMSSNEIIFKVKPKTRLDLLKPKKGGQVVVKELEEFNRPPIFVVDDKPSTSFASSSPCQHTSPATAPAPSTPQSTASQTTAEFWRAESYKQKTLNAQVQAKILQAELQLKENS
nr:unnamed protein product [Callosobruchus analis]